MTLVKTHVVKLTITYVILNIPTSSTLNSSMDGRVHLKPFSSSESDFSNCLSLVTKQNLPCNNFISIIYSKFDVKNALDYIIKDECYSFLIKTFNSTNGMTRNKFYIILAENYLELKSGLFSLRRDALWNPEAKFLVVIKNTNNRDTKEIFQKFLELNMYNIIYFNYEGKNTSLSTYYPFRNTNCGDNMDQIVIMGDCLNTNYSKHIFINNVDKSRNCKFRAVKFPDKVNSIPTVEQYVFDTFVFFSNFTVEYEIIKADKNYGIVLPNGTVTGLLRYLERDLADVAVGSTVLIMNRANLFDFIYGSNYDSFQLYTSALGNEMWKKVYKEFDEKTYLIILLYYCLIVLVFVIFLKAVLKNRIDYTYIIVTLWGYFYGGNGTLLYPKIIRFRFVTLCWIWFTFFISSFYNSDMYSLITGHIQRVRQIEPNKLNSLPYKPCIPDVIRTFFYFAYSEHLPENNETPGCDQIDEALNTTADGIDLYTVQLKPSYQEREMDFIDKHGHRKLDAWDFGSDILLGFYVKRGFPFKDKMLEYAQYMFETGLVQHYKEKLSPPKGALRRKGISTPFILGDFRVHFGVLFIGSIISILVFSFEIILFNKEK